MCLGNSFVCQNGKKIVQSNCQKNNNNKISNLFSSKLKIYIIFKRAVSTIYLGLYLDQLSVCL